MYVAESFTCHNRPGKLVNIKYFFGWPDVYLQPNIHTYKPKKNLFTLGTQYTSDVVHFFIFFSNKVGDT